MARQAKPIEHARAQRLFDAAAEEFIGYGYERASLNRILERSGVSKSSFYHFFADKAGLFDALVRDYAGAFTKPHDLHAVARAPMAEALEQIANRLSELALSQPKTLALGRLLGIPDAPATPVVREFGASVLRAVLSALTTWRARGEASSALPLQLQLRALFAMLRVADAWVLERGLEPRSMTQALALLRSVL